MGWWQLVVGIASKGRKIRKFSPRHQKMAEQESNKIQWYVLVIVDCFSRFIITFAVPDIQAAIAIQCLESTLHQYLIPIAI